MANKKITELQLAFDVGMTDLMIIEKMDQGTCAINAKALVGEAGPMGPVGPKGEQGIQGVKGEVGPVGPVGPKGDIGPKGEVGPIGPKGADGNVKFEELTPGQVEQLRGPQGIQGPKGDKGLTGDRGLQGVQGPQGIKGDKGDKGDTLYPSNLLQIVQRDIGGIKKGDVLTGMKLEQILEKMLCYVPPAPTFVGMLDYKPRNEITFEDLNSDPKVTRDIVVKPQTVYNNPHGFIAKIGIVLAIPKSFGTIAGIVDGANISIEGAYSWEDVVLDVPDIGPVEYSICFPDDIQMANSGTTVKWSIE